MGCEVFVYIQRGGGGDYGNVAKRWSGRRGGKGVGDQRGVLTRDDRKRKWRDMRRKWRMI